MRILQVLRAPVGGLFRHVNDLTRGLVARGHDVGIVLDAADAGPRWEQVIRELEGIANLGVLRTPMARRIDLNDVSAIRAIHATIRTGCYDVVHGHGAKGGAYSRIAGLLARRQMPHLARIYTPHGGSLHFSPTSVEGVVYHNMERQLAKASEAIIFESAFARDGFQRIVKVDTGNAPVVHNGLSDGEFEPVWPANDACDILFVGELRHLKGVDVLLRALALLHTDAAPCPTALIVGGGPDEAEFRALADKLGIADRIRWEAPMPARNAFAQGRHIICPSRAESLPYLVLEAIAAGLPMIATNVGGIPEIFGPHKEHLIEADNVSLLAQRIRALLDDSAAARAEADALRSHVRGIFNLDQMVDGIVDVYRQHMPGCSG